MSRVRSIAKQLSKKTCMSSLPVASSSSSLKLFRTPQSSIENGPSFVLRLMILRSFCSRTTLTSSEGSSFSSCSSSQLTSSIHGGSFPSRDLSSLLPTVEVNHNTSSSSYPEVGSCNINNKEDLSIPVRAYFFSTSIDLKGLMSENQVNFVPPTSPVANHVLLRFFGDTNSHPRDLAAATLSRSTYSYMVVFQYGSIVTFNIVGTEVDGYLKIIERHASGLLPEMTRDGEVFLQNKISGLEYTMPQHLNIDGIRMIGCVLGQGVALDYHIRQVDGLMAEYTNVNHRMEKTGTSISYRKLEKVQQKVNNKLPDVILKVGLVKRSGIAAEEDAKYNKMREFLQAKLELTQRFECFDFKLKLLEQNILYYGNVLISSIQYCVHIAICGLMTAMFVKCGTPGDLIETLLNWLVRLVPPPRGA